MSTINILKSDITAFDLDAVVYAANTGLWQGGVCGAIFRKAGSAELTAACSKYVHRDVGSAVITPGFHLQAKYIIHAVGSMASTRNPSRSKVRIMHRWSLQRKTAAIP